MGNAKWAEKLAGKKVAIIGGTSGVGFGVAELLLAAGAHVTVISSTPNKVQSAVERLGSPNASGAVGDVRQEEEFTSLLVARAPFDHLVFCSVDQIIRGELKDTNLDEAKYLFGVKFWGAVICGKASLKHDIIVPGGSLTLTSGIVAWKPAKHAAIGSGLSAGICAVTRSLALDLAVKKVRVNCVVPGFVMTELWDKTWTNHADKEIAIQRIEAQLPLGFLGRPEDVAESYLYAIRADYVTGTLITVDGGGSLQ